jgi:cell division septum initiation protein DivIVA
LLQAAAKPAANQLRRQSDDRAADIMSEASWKADSVITQAKRQAGEIAGQQ